MTPAWVSRVRRGRDRRDSLHWDTTLHARNTHSDFESRLIKNSPIADDREALRHARRQQSPLFALAVAG